MSRERSHSLEARLPGRLQSALAQQRARAEQRRLSHEQGEDARLCYPGEKDGHFQTPFKSEYPEAMDQEIATFPQAGVIYECTDLTGGDNNWLEEVRRHNGVYNQSVSLDWQDANPAEDSLK